LSPVELGIKISNELNKLDDQFALKDVKKLYKALFEVDPAMRYAVFKEAAEYKLKRKWDCDGIKAVYDKPTSKY